MQVGCQLPTKVPRDHLYRVGPAYSLNNETDIMIEIFESGPVQGKILSINRTVFFKLDKKKLVIDLHICIITATMRVYRDFFAYRGGVYRHSAASRNSEPSGFHSVRLIGWGEERNGYEITKYWVSSHELIGIV